MHGLGGKRVGEARNSTTQLFTMRLQGDPLFPRDPVPANFYPANNQDFRKELFRTLRTVTYIHATGAAPRQETCHWWRSIGERGRRHQWHITLNHWSNYFLLAIFVHADHRRVPRNNVGGDAQQQNLGFVLHFIICKHEDNATKNDKITEKSQTPITVNRTQGKAVPSPTGNGSVRSPHLRVL